MMTGAREAQMRHSFEVCCRLSSKDSVERSPQDHHLALDGLSAVGKDHALIAKVLGRTGSTGD